MLISTPVTDFISKSINISINGEPYLIKVMEEKAPNEIFSMKSDHVFKELSDSNVVSSESWSLDDDVEDEASVAFLGGGDVNGGRSSTSGKKGDDDVEVEDEVMEEDDRDEQPRYRWSQEHQNTNGAQLSAVNDIAFNAADSQDKQQTNGDDKIQICCSSNHEKSIANLEVVPDSQGTQICQNKECQIAFNAADSQDKQQTNGDDKIQICCSSNHEKSIANLEVVPDSQGTQICQNKEWQRKWVTEGPLTMSSPLEDDPLENNDNWATNNCRPLENDTFKFGGSKPTNEEADV
ncbi:hypothetical protein SLE2022_357910 [Rubroshorea leprosula]